MPDPFNANLRPHEILRRSQRASRVTRPMPATASFRARFAIPIGSSTRQLIAPTHLATMSSTTLMWWR
jgi:hypothetical protein